MSAIARTAMSPFDSILHSRVTRATAGRRAGVMAFLLAVLVGAGGLAAQSQDNGALSRAQLEQLAAEAERDASSASSGTAREQRRKEAETIRQRLRDGDFQVGDRIVVTVQGETFLTDTFTVRAGRVVTLPNLPDISMQGVLRSELASHLTREIGKFVREPSVKATSLIRIAVMGEVSQPGFYAVPADFLASDVIMAAGGPTPNAEMKKSIMRRGGTVVLDRTELQKAIADGRTLDMLDVRPGDELVVGRRVQRDWRSIMYVVGAAVGLIGTVVALAN
jgi:hypothetical protein